jgi:hypothetical protein
MMGRVSGQSGFDMLMAQPWTGSSGFDARLPRPTRPSKASSSPRTSRPKVPGTLRPTSEVFDERSLADTRRVSGGRWM